MQKPGDLLVPVPAGLVWNGFAIVYTQRSHLYGFHNTAAIQKSSKSAQTACGASSSPLTKITAGIYRISGGVYGGCGGILTFNASSLNYNAWMAMRYTAQPIRMFPFVCFYRHGQRRFRPCNDQSCISLMRFVMQNYPSGTLHSAYSLLEVAIIQWQNHSRLGLQHQATRMHRDSA